MKILLEKVAKIFFILIFISTLYACQSTPEGSTVINKGDNNLDDAILNSSGNSNLNTEKLFTYEENLLNNNTLKVNAKILTPDTDNLPVIQIKLKDFQDGQSMENLIKSIYPSADIFKHSGVKTKFEIESEIIKVKSYINKANNVAKNQFINSEDVIETYDIELLNDELKKLEKSYSTAPDNKPADPPEYSLTLTDDNSYQAAFESKINKNLTATFDIVNSKEGNMLLVNTNINLIDSGIYFNQNDMQENSSFITAKTLADTTLNNMGIDYLKLNTISYGTLIEKDGNEIPKSGYCFFYTPTFQNVQQTFVDNYIGTTATGIDGQTYMSTITPEYLRIDISDNNVVKLRWDNPSEVIETENSNVATLEWNNIKEIFIKQSKRIFNNEPYNNMIINVNRAELGLAKVIKKGSNNQYRLIPAWSFFATIQDKQKESLLTDECIVTINAIDGSIIDRGLMY